MGCEEILEIADRGDGRGAPVKQIVDQSHQLAIPFGNQRVHRLGLVEKAIPRQDRYGRRQAGRPDTTVKFIPSLA
jgi:hypothetical protein